MGYSVLFKQILFQIFATTKKIPLRSLILSLIKPLSYMNFSMVPRFYTSKPMIICMAGPPPGKGDGNMGTKMVNSTLTPKDGYRQNVSTHSDESK